MAFLSCSSDSKVTESLKLTQHSNAYEMLPLRQELIRHSEEEQREMFRNLTPEQCVEVWQNKLAQVLTQELTDEQRVHIEKVYGKLVPEVYSDTTAENTREFREFMASWASQAKKLFTENQARDIVALLYDYHPAPDYIYSGAGCNCSVSDSYCFFSSCEKKCFFKTTRGCGTFYMYPCNGSCGVQQLIPGW